MRPSIIIVSILVFAAGLFVGGYYPARVSALSSPEDGPLVNANVRGGVVSHDPPQRELVVEFPNRYGDGVPRRARIRYRIDTIFRMSAIRAGSGASSGSEATAGDIAQGDEVVISIPLIGAEDPLIVPAMWIIKHQ